MQARVVTALVAFLASGCGVPQISMEGRKCDPERPCGLGLFCTDGICLQQETQSGDAITDAKTPPKAIGETCSVGSDCGSDFCADGVCCATACGACGTCSLPDSRGACVPKAAGTVCRAALSGALCDVAEVCSGQGVHCPADGFVAANVPCRPSAGVCDVAETCSGTGPQCPVDAFAPSTTTCRASTGACDATERCTSGSAFCPADAAAPSGTVCRAAASACDAAETCNGTSLTCPSDSVQPAGTLCRRAAFACDAEETCNGSSASCPTDAAAANGAVCLGGICSSGTCTNATTGPADDFNLDTLSTSLWVPYQDPGTSVTASGGRVQVTTASYAYGYVGVSHNGMLDLRGRGCSGEITDAGDISLRSYSPYFDLYYSSGNALSLGVHGNVMHFKTWVNNTSTIIGSLPYDPSTMRHWRIREYGGNVIGEVSATGDVWTRLGQTSAPFDVSSLQLNFGAGNWTASTWSTQASFDNINLRNDVYNQFTTDPGCSAAIVSGELKATIASGQNSQDTAYGERDFGGSSGTPGRLYARTAIRLGAETAVGDLYVLRIVDVAGRVLVDLIVDESRSLRVSSPAGSLAATAIDRSLGVSAPSTGTSTVRVELSVLANDSLVVRVNDVESVAVTGLSGATSGNARWLRAGVIMAARANGSGSRTVYQKMVNVSSIGWLGATP